MLKKKFSVLLCSFFLFVQGLSPASIVTAQEPAENPEEDLTEVES